MTLSELGDLGDFVGGIVVRRGFSTDFVSHVEAAIRSVV
jgi:hypothetical protein